MKKFITLAMLLVAALTVHAQKDVTKFLGIPVDGTKSEMIRKLKAKGFTSSAYDKDILEGEFNGKNVNVHIVTNNNKVYRIMVADARGITETDIKIRFNNLCHQFENNKNYIPISDIDKSQQIPEDENILYEMTVNKKRYGATYIQFSREEALKDMNSHFALKYTDEQLSNPTPEIVAEMEDYIYKQLEASRHKSVWFMINELYGEYYILMYYDNKYNQANGEDL